MTLPIPVCKVIEREPMSRHTSWRTGGVAEHYAVPQTLDELRQLIISLPADENIEWMGLGSNTLVRDAGFNGTLIATQHVMNEVHFLDNHTVHVGAGVADAKLARLCAKKGLYNAAFFAGIPGLIGGALAMNAGAWGDETWSHVVSVETMNRQGKICQRNSSEFEVSYRHVDNLNGEWFVSAVMHFAHKTDDKLIEEKDVTKIKQLLEKRAYAQPTGVASCGSVFRNPVDNYAAYLIENAGLKGQRIGGAVVSDKHANFIINDKQASAENIESLIKLIQKRVKQQSGILLQTEVKIIGERSW